MSVKRISNRARGGRTRAVLAAVCALALAAAQGCGGRADDRASGSARGELGGSEGSGQLVYLTPDQSREIGIVTAAAGPAPISRSLRLPAEVAFNGDRLVHLTMPVSGIARDVRAGLGDTVGEGDLLAVVESRELADAKTEYLAWAERLALAETIDRREEELYAKGISSEQEHLDARRDFVEARIESRSALQKLYALGLARREVERLGAAGLESDLTRYELRSPMRGTVVSKHIVAGEALESGREIFLLADLRTVWIDAKVHQADLGAVREGQAALVDAGGGGPGIEGAISYVGSFVAADTRTAMARIVLENEDGSLRPGSFVTVVVETGGEEAPVAVPAGAVQTLGDRQVVFVPEHHDEEDADEAGHEDGAAGSHDEEAVFAAVPVTTGRRDGKFVEIVSGLSAGDLVVAGGAWQLKAALLAGSLDPHAGHGH
ncbi:MAG: efflux RND transporter periplasmic adaptor subunit [Candidatus Krumholzibacteria bacterium]|nr:efflux RND transporter periplasmic adaptor subunit [Candidatus Krumholzibacteria bacterium]